MIPIPTTEQARKMIVMSKNVTDKFRYLICEVDCLGKHIKIIKQIDEYPSENILTEISNEYGIRFLSVERIFDALK
jgi:hypothetical protein